MLGTRLTIELLQRRLIVEQVELRRRADHVQENDALGPRSMMRLLRGSRINRRIFTACFIRQEPAKRERAKAHAGALAQRTSGEASMRIAECGLRSDGE